MTDVLLRVCVCVWGGGKPRVPHAFWVHEVPQRPALHSAAGDFFGHFECEWVDPCREV